MNGLAFTANCFGLRWLSDLPLKSFDPAAEPDADAETAAISVTLVDTLPHREAKRTVGRAAITEDGFRFCWNEEATFDMAGGSAIAVLPGPGWTGELPPSFFSSVAGLTMAWRGLTVLHASSVVIGGKAWLVGGRAGAGKSTLVAALVDGGAAFLSDDLTVLENGFACRGRAAMRLHPGSAAQIDSLRRAEVPDDPRGKELVWPRRRALDRRWPVAGLVIAGSGDLERMAPAQAAAHVGAMQFRPQITKALPRLAKRRAALLDLARNAPVYRFPALDSFDCAARRKWREAFALIESEVG